MYRENTFQIPETVLLFSAAKFGLTDIGCSNSCVIATVVPLQERHKAYFVRVRSFISLR